MILFLNICLACVNQTTTLVCGSGSSISKCENTKSCSKDSDCISDFCRVADQTCQSNKKKGFVTWLEICL